MPSFDKIVGLFDGRTQTGVLDISETGVKFILAARTIECPIGDIVKVSGFQSFHGFVLSIHRENDTLRFVGILSEVVDSITKALADIGHTINIQELSVKGANWTDIEIEHGMLSFMLHDKLIFDVPVSQINQTVLQNKNEIALEFKPNERRREDAEELCEIRFFVHNDNANDMGDSDGTPATLLNERLQQVTIQSEGGSSKPITRLENLMCVVPRGKYNLDIYDTQFRMSTRTFNYSIKYEHITRLFALEKPDNQTAFVIGLEPPIRQGSTSYPFLIFEFNNEDEARIPITLDMTPEELQTKFGDKLTTNELVMGEQESVPFLFHLLTGLRVTRANSEYQSTLGVSCLRATCKANDGLLFLLKNGLFFIRKPAMHIRFQDIDRVSFDRLPGMSSLAADTHSFDLIVVLKGETSPIVEFVSLHVSEFDNLFKYLQSKDVPIDRVNELAKLVGKMETGIAKRSTFTDEDMSGFAAIMQDAGLADGMNDDDDEDDEAFSDVGSESSDDYSTDGEVGGSDDEGSDGEDDGEEGEESKKKKEKKESKKEKKPKEDKPKKEKAPKAEKKAAGDEDGKKKKKRKEPGQPKAASNAFVFFSTAKRQEVKDAHPEIAKSVAEISRKLGEMWGQLTDEQKIPYQKQAEADKARYEEEMKEWKAKKAAEGETEDVSEDQPKQKKQKTEE